jgi:hypothetical protein
MAMNKLLLAATMGALVLINAAHAGEDITMKLGRFGSSASGAYVEQQITIINNTSGTIQYVSVNCGFFHAGQLVDTNSGWVTNVQPNTEAYTSVSVPSKLQPESAKCRIENAR